MSDDSHGVIIVELPSKSALVSIKPGQYTTPFGSLTIGHNPDGSVIQLDMPDGKKVQWAFNMDGKFRNFNVATAAPVLSVVVPDPGKSSNDGVVFVCDHVKPGYSGILFTGGGGRAAQVYVCAECARKTGLMLESKRVQFIVRELFNKAVLPNCQVIQFQEPAKGA